MPAISLERERVKLAWEQVSTIQANAELLKKYRSQVRGFPAMVQSMGIGQAAAFLGSKSKDEEYRLLLAHITAWAFYSLAPSGCPKRWTIPWGANLELEGENRLIRQLKAEQPEVWWIADREIIAYSVWLKRLAESLAG